MFKLSRNRIALVSAASSLLLIVSCSSDGGTNGPANPGTLPTTLLGSSTNGQQVFRFETFGNEGFWTNAVRLQQGMMNKTLTPLQALKLGTQLWLRFSGRGQQQDAHDSTPGRSYGSEFRSAQ